MKIVILKLCIFSKTIHHHRHFCNNCPSFFTTDISTTPAISMATLSNR